MQLMPINRELSNQCDTNILLNTLLVPSDGWSLSSSLARMSARHGLAEESNIMFGSGFPHLIVYLHRPLISVQRLNGTAEKMSRKR